MGESERTTRSVVYPPSKLGSKFKHAAAFGVVESYSRVGVAAFEAALRRHVDAATTVTVHGTFRGTMVVTMYVDARTGLMVMTRRDGRFMSGWRLNPEQLQQVLERGTL